MTRTTNLGAAGASLALLLAASAAARPGSPAAGERAPLQAFHSARCLGGTAGPAAEECGAAGAIAALPVGGAPERVLLRSERTGRCLFANADGRFGFWDCNAAFPDQHWDLVRAGPGADPAVNASIQPGWRQLRTVHTGTCLYSNSDGRFGVYTCNPAWSDQFWRFSTEPAPIQALHSGRCLTPPGAAQPCGPSSPIELMLLAGGRGAVMIRQAGANRCLYSNADGRFAWYDCNPAWSDQHWTGLLPPDAPPEARIPRARHRMLRADHSGQCLYSNADGRYGLYACTPAIADQYWRVGLGTPAMPPTAVVVAPPPVAPPPTIIVVAPPAPAPRDCGTGPSDVGCQESRDGQPAMDRDAWSGLYATLRATPSDLTKADMIKGACAERHVTAQQLMLALDLFRSDLVKLDVTKALAGRIVDPQRAKAYGPKIRSSLSRQEFLELVGR